MTTQAAMIMDTIMGMTRTIAQDSAADDSSQSEDPYLLPSNRGIKLKRKARDPLQGPSVRKKGRTAYTTTIEHAGYKRDILRRNPKRYDIDGDELDSDDEDEEADARAAEENPYGSIKLENLLRPLSSVAKLPEHPSLSVPYLSSTLSDMAGYASKSVQHERKTLETAKLLLLKMRGDETWIPTEQLNASDDVEIFATRHVFEKIITGTTKRNNYSNCGDRLAASNGVDVPTSRNIPVSEVDLGNVNLTESKGPPIKDAPDPEAIHVTKADAPSEKVEGALNEELASGHVNGHKETPDINGQHVIEGLTKDPSRDQPIKSTADPPDRNVKDSPDSSSARDENHDPVESKPEEHVGAPLDTNDAGSEKYNDSIGKEANPTDTTTIENGSGEMEVDGVESRPAPRRMRTRAQVQAASDPAASLHSESVEPIDVPPPIHPIFLLPPTAKVDPNYGLSEQEAEETRRLLMIYVQKQEEICRSAEQLYEGLLKADRQRLEVLKWCKAEGHVGEMSDGEDWYDKGEWGLEEDLRKGEADDRLVDEDVGVQGKKTRGRRA